MYRQTQKTRTHKLLQKMLDAMPMCSNCWNTDLRIILCNDKAVRLFELSNKDEYLRRFDELSPEYQSNGRSSRELVQEYIKNAFEEGYFRFEWMHQKPNGELMPAEITLIRSHFDDEEIVVSHMRDLRQHYEDQEKLREAEERVHIMLDATPICCSFWDKDNNVVDCNQEAVKLFGLENKKEFLDRFLELSPEYQPCGRKSSQLVIENMRIAFERGYYRREWIHKKLDGEIIPSEITLVRVKHRNDYIVAGYTRDLRELKATLKEMHKVEADLRLARDIAEESTSAKSSFLANMSHEIRTPINAITGMATIARSTNNINKIHDCLDVIDVSSRQLLGIINDILDMSKIEARKMELACEPFDIRTTISNIRSIIGMQAEKKEQNLMVTIADNVPKLVLGDDMRLSQIFLNLLSNAVKFTPDKGNISFDLRLVDSQDGLNYMEAQVKDNGIGISPDQHERLFRSFEQAEKETSRRYGGTGLGLAISKHIAQLMNGDIQVDSELGKGSCFTVRFCMESSGKDITTHSDEKTAYSFKDSRILLVEDVEINQEIVKALLSEYGFTIDCADNGKLAVNMFLENPMRYDIIFMDVHMPVMDGYTATRAIRNSIAPNAKTIPILAMTANAFSEDVKECLEAGMDDHIAKPVDLDLLLGKITHLLAEKDSISINKAAAAQNEITISSHCKKKATLQHHHAKSSNSFVSLR